MGNWTQPSSQPTAMEFVDTTIPQRQLKNTLCVRTGLYSEKCLTWEDMPNAEKTWPNWKSFFTKVVHNHRKLCKAAGMNYQANGVLQDNLQQDTVDALANLASAANSSLAAQIKALNEHNTK
eukprot:5777145-Ditylum_brightwellii.AAC.1